MISIKERNLVLHWNQKRKTQQEIAELLGCNQSSISRLIRKYRTKGTIRNLPRSGRPTKLKGKTFIRLRNIILDRVNSANAEYNSVSTKQIGEIIRQEIGEIYSIRHVERIMHRLGFSLITPRSRHLRHDPKKVDIFRDEFKKKRNRNMWIVK